MTDTTIRERQVFAALLEEFFEHPSLNGSSIRVGDLEMALERFKTKTLRFEKDEAWFNKAMEVDTSREDYRE